MSFSGGAEVNTKYSKNESDFNSQTDIEIKYLGANNDAFVKSISIEDLNLAILEFPAHCTGNIFAYVLWPYESS